jgi:hypothetical protein
MRTARSSTVFVLFFALIGCGDRSTPSAVADGEVVPDSGVPSCPGVPTEAASCPCTWVAYMPAEGPPFVCTNECTTSADCAPGLGCAPEGYCLLTCADDYECSVYNGGAGSVGLCDTGLGVCTLLSPTTTPDAG